VLSELAKFRGAQAIHAGLRCRGERVGLTTACRHLRVLSEDGTVDAIGDKAGETLYRRCATSTRRLHITCRSCGRSVDVKGPAIEDRAQHVATEAGFTDPSTPGELRTVFRLGHVR
jgi:Fur family transcriptional regulator, ferric uptake regulator